MFSLVGPFESHVDLAPISQALGSRHFSLRFSHPLFVFPGRAFGASKGAFQLFVFLLLLFFSPRASENVKNLQSLDNNHKSLSAQLLWREAIVRQWRGAAGIRGAVTCYFGIAGHAVVPLYVLYHCRFCLSSYYAIASFALVGLIPPGFVSSYD